MKIRTRMGCWAGVGAKSSSSSLPSLDIFRNESAVRASSTPNCLALALVSRLLHPSCILRRQIHHRGPSLTETLTLSVCVCVSWIFMIEHHKGKLNKYMYKWVCVCVVEWEERECVCVRVWDSENEIYKWWHMHIHGTIHQLKILYIYYSLKITSFE